MPRLVRLGVKEVSYVDRPANKRKFLLLKNEGDKVMPELILEVKKGVEDLFKSLAESVNKDGSDVLVKNLGLIQKEEFLKSLDLVNDKSNEVILKAIGDKEISATLCSIVKNKDTMSLLESLVKEDKDLNEAITKAGVPKESISAVKIALKALGGVKGNLTDDVLLSISKLGGFAKTEAKFQIKKNDDGSLNLDNVPKDMHDVFIALHKTSEDSEKRTAKIEKDLKAERDTRLEAEFVIKAETYKTLPLEAAKFGPVLKRVSESVSEEDFVELSRVLKAANEAQSGLLKEIGSSTSSEDDKNTAIYKLESIAKSIAEKDGTTVEVAFEKALDLNPDLAKQERDERDAA